VTDERITASSLWTLVFLHFLRAFHSRVAYTGILCSSAPFYRRILWREGVFEMILCFTSARKWHERFSRPTFRPRFYIRLREHILFSLPACPEESVVPQLRSGNSRRCLFFILLFTRFTRLYLILRFYPIAPYIYRDCPRTSWCTSLLISTSYFSSFRYWKFPNSSRRTFPCYFVAVAHT